MFTKENVKKIQYKRWRNQRGIKLVVSIVPYKKMFRAVAVFEGKKYHALGATNVHALNSLFEDLSGTL